MQPFNFLMKYINEKKILVHGGRVVRCRTCYREVVGSNPTDGCSVPTPTQRGRLMSISESWGVNGHTTRYTVPVSVVLRLRLVPGWELRKRRSAPPQGPWGLGKDFTILFTLMNCSAIPYVMPWNNEFDVSHIAHEWQKMQQPQTDIKMLLLGDPLIWIARRVDIIMTYTFVVSVSHWHGWRTTIFFRMKPFWVWQQRKQCIK